MSRSSLVVLSGPSGVGKSSIIAQLLLHERCRLAVSAATRQPREGEIEGVHYRFMTREAFERLVAARALLEYAQVHDQMYGTPVDEVDPWIAQGWMVILDVDVQGYRSIKRLRPEAVGVFVAPPTFDELRLRLIARGSETEASLERRLEHARREMQAAGEYDHLVINDDLALARRRIEGILGLGEPVSRHD